MEWSLFIVSVLSAAVRMGIPIAFAGIGVVISEKAGVLNIGCEAEMLMGAFVTFVVAYSTGSTLLGVVAGGVSGMLVALIIGYLAISRKQDQSVVGIVLNMFMVGFTSFLYRALYGNQSSLSINTIDSMQFLDCQKFLL